MTQKQERQLLKELNILGGGWGPYSSALTREQRLMLNTREKTKLDVEYKKLLDKAGLNLQNGRRFCLNDS